MYKIILFLTCKAASTDAENDFTELLEHLASSSFISDKILFKRGHGAFAKIGELKSKFQLRLNNFSKLYFETGCQPTRHFCTSVLPMGY